MSAVCTSVCTNNAENGDRSDMKRLAEALRKQLSDDERQRLAEQLMANQAEEDAGGHSRKVSRKHYLMVSDEIFAMATNEKSAAESAAESAAVGPRTDSHDVTNAEERKEERPALPVICEAMRGVASEADGTRTRNHRIDSPVL